MSTNVFEPVTNLFEAKEVAEKRDETTRKLIEFSIHELEREWSLQYPKGEVPFGEFVESIHVPHSIRKEEPVVEDTTEEVGLNAIDDAVMALLVGSVFPTCGFTSLELPKKAHVKTLAEEIAEQPRYSVPSVLHSRCALNRLLRG